MISSPPYLLSEQARLEAALLGAGFAHEGAALPLDRASAQRLILVVDDDAEMRAYMMACLRAFGQEAVLEAADGAAALRLARAHMVALIISDVVMPGLDGLRLRSFLRNDVALSGIPVLLITGEVGPIEAPVLRKPFNAHTLWAHVRPLLDAEGPVRA